MWVQKRRVGMSATTDSVKGTPRFHSTMVETGSIPGRSVFLATLGTLPPRKGEYARAKAGPIAR